MIAATRAAHCYERPQGPPECRSLCSPVLEEPPSGYQLRLLIRDLGRRNLAYLRVPPVLLDLHVRDLYTSVGQEPRIRCTQLYLKVPTRVARPPLHGQHASLADAPPIAAVICDASPSSQPVAVLEYMLTFD